MTFRVNSWSNAIDTPSGGGKNCATGQGPPPGIAVPTNYTFDIGITEDVTGFFTRSTSVTVNPFGSPSLDDTSPGTWREEFR